jgi:hypothetical protein
VGAITSRGWGSSARTDTNAKRNMALVLSRMLGWSRVLFLDDDITELKPDDVRRASGLLDTYNAVGLHVDGFPDHSVVCHAYRQAGGSQQAFIGGGHWPSTWSAAPPSFLISTMRTGFSCWTVRGIQPVGVTGTVRQFPYDPFRTADRARGEELGDVLAEGIYWLLDQGGSVTDADQAHWIKFLVGRRRFIERVLRAWAADRQRWHRYLQKSLIRSIQQLPGQERRQHAVAALPRPGVPRLTWESSAQGRPLELDSQPHDRQEPEAALAVAAPAE